MEIDSGFGERIRTRREELCMSQDELAKRCGYASRVSISKIESGVRKLPTKKIGALAAALRMDPAYLMGWVDELGNDIRDEDTATTEALQKLAKRPELKALLDAGSKLSEEDITNVIRIMESMSK